MSIYNVPIPDNEPILSYAPGSDEKAALDQTLAELKAAPIDIPMFINGEEVRTGTKIEITSPHNHKLVLGHYHQGGETEVKKAVEAALEAQKSWALVPWEHRAAIFLKAAELIAGPYRHVINAATMLAHSKNVFQAEIDAVCELVDFLRFNAYYMQQIYEIQPESAPMIWDRLEYRPLEGFIFAVTPFNFVSISGNLPSAPTMLGNVAVWKPASTAVYTSHFLMQIFREAGLPSGVINMIFARGAAIGDTSATLSCATATWPVSISPARPQFFRTCGARSVRTSPTTAPIRALSAKPAARTSLSLTPRLIRMRSSRPSFAALLNSRDRNVPLPHAVMFRKLSGAR